MNPLNSSELKQIFLAAGLDPEAETEAQMIALIESHIAKHTQETELKARKSQTDHLFSVMRHLGYEIDKKAVMKLSREWNETALKSKTGGK